MPTAAGKCPTVHSDSRPDVSPTLFTEATPTPTSDFGPCADIDHRSPPSIVCAFRDVYRRPESEARVRLNRCRIDPLHTRRNRGVGSEFAESNGPVLGASEPSDPGIGPVGVGRH
jgi:hypothetical protein